jgi:hypothetical protein
MSKSEWIARFVAHFSERMAVSGYRGDDLAEMASQHAEASWGTRDPELSPEEAATGEIDALADSM